MTSANSNQIEGEFILFRASVMYSQFDAAKQHLNFITSKIVDFVSVNKSPEFLKNIFHAVDLLNGLVEKFEVCNNEDIVEEFNMIMYDLVHTTLLPTLSNKRMN